MKNVGAFVALGLAPKGKVVISPFRGSNYHYTRLSFSYLPYGQLLPYVNLVSATYCLPIGRVSKYPNQLAPYILIECLLRCSGEMWIHLVRPSGAL